MNKDLNFDIYKLQLSRSHAVLSDELKILHNIKSWQLVPVGFIFKTTQPVLVGKQNKYSFLQNVLVGKQNSFNDLQPILVGKQNSFNNLQPILVGKQNVFNNLQPILVGKKNILIYVKNMRIFSEKIKYIWTNQNDSNKY